MTTAAGFRTSKKTIGQSSLPSPQAADGNCLPRPGTLFPECCLKENACKFDLHTVIVMPDHAHLLLSPLRDGNGWNFNLPEIMHDIKGACARKINVLLGRSCPVWQEEFFDHVLRSTDTLAGKADYIGQNPVRAGLVKAEGEYRWL
jgi:REP element-mobilizing transposase RayT